MRVSAGPNEYDIANYISVLYNILVLRLKNRRKSIWTNQNGFISTINIRHYNNTYLLSAFLDRPYRYIIRAEL